MTSRADVLTYLIEKGPGRTEVELSNAIFGVGGYQQQVNDECRLLVERGAIRREGGGGSGDPYRYFIA